MSDILFDPNLEIRVMLSHNYGIGAVLSQEMSDGSEKPVFAV